MTEKARSGVSQRAHDYDLSHQHLISPQGTGRKAQPPLPAHVWLRNKPVVTEICEQNRTGAQLIPRSWQTAIHFLTCTAPLGHMAGGRCAQGSVTYALATRPHSARSVWKAPSQILPFSSRPHGDSVITSCSVITLLSAKSLHASHASGYLLGCRVQRCQLQAGAVPSINETTIWQLKVKFWQILDTHLNILPKTEKQKIEFWYLRTLLNILWLC